MDRQVGLFLDEVRSHLHLDLVTERRVLNELYTHFQEKVGDLQDQGMADGEAIREALASFGDARSIARLMDEAYGRGSWLEALISSQPHLIVAALFATHIWRYPVLLGAAFAAIVIIALMGWRQGTPNWLYSWVGYAVLPLLIFSYVSVDPVAQAITYVFRGRGLTVPLWQLAGLALLYGFTLWLIATASVRVARRDWILVSLMLLPLPVLLVWMVTITRLDGFYQSFLRGMESGISRWDGGMAYFCLVLGVTTVVFVRMRQRALKVLAIIVVGMICGALALRNLWGDVGLLSLVGISIGLFLFLTIPFLLRALMGSEGHGKTPLAF
ncbi:MAG TPA: permease prefix domain 1-containing protein [Spirochaetia bacterium]|nr:permease prefix domain 1-containing protein [Spirochaetia bacterium]